MDKVELGDSALFGNIAFLSEQNCFTIEVSNSRFMKQSVKLVIDQCSLLPGCIAVRYLLELKKNFSSS